LVVIVHGGNEASSYKVAAAKHFQRLLDAAGPAFCE
jgi:hypothetical protein